MQRNKLRPPHLIIVAALPCEIWNTKKAREHNFSF